MSFPSTFRQHVFHSSFSITLPAFCWQSLSAHLQAACFSSDRCLIRGALLITSPSPHTASPISPASSPSPQVHSSFSKLLRTYCVTYLSLPKDITLKLFCVKFRGCPFPGAEARSYCETKARKQVRFQTSLLEMSWRSSR